MAAPGQINLKKGDTPVNPIAGYMGLYFKDDGNLYARDDSGVETAVASTGGGILSFEVAQTSHGFTVLTPVYYGTLSGVWLKAYSGQESHFVVAVKDADTFTIANLGIHTISGHGLTPGETNYAGPVAGTLTTTEPGSWNLTIYPADINTIQIQTFKVAAEPLPEANTSYITHGSSGLDLTDCDEYFPPTWTSKTNASTGRGYVAGFGFIDTTALYSVGGFSSVDLQTNEEYTPDTWTNRTNLPTPARRYHAASDLGTKGYVMGGTGYIDDCDEYSPPGTDSWAAADAVPDAIQYNCAFTINESVHSASGKPGVQNAHYRYTVNVWTTETNKINTLYNCAAFAQNDKGYVCGGDTSQIVEECVDPGTWTARTSMPSPGRYYFDGAGHATAAYVSGGHSSTYLADNDEYVFDTWTSKDDIPSPARNSCTNVELST